MKRKFVNRVEELKILEEEYAKDRPSFIVIYGRRRVGKTRLIEEFVKNKKYFYYLAADEKEHLQIKEFKEGIANFLNDEVLLNLNITDWKTLLSYIEKIWPKNEKIILIIDEYSYLIKHNPSVPSYFQKFWDLFLSKTKTKLILCGSLVSVMLRNVLEGGSPLYGRRTSEIHVEKFSVKEVMEFLNTGLEEAIKFYAVLDGIPKYLEMVEGSFESFIKKIMNKRSFFYREGYYLMSEELKDISTYLNILMAIAEGNTRISEISNFTGMEVRKIYPYLDILENLGFVKKHLPLFGKRDAIYLIEDNFLDFWFRFIHKYRSYIEMNEAEKIMKKIFLEINAFTGKKFEKVCGWFLRKHAPFKPTSIGKQWGKIPGRKETYEIDIVALNEKTREILFAECKWRSRVNAEKVCKELVEKAEHVEWHSNRRKEILAVFAKSFSKRIDEFEGRKVFCFDLRDLENFLKKRLRSTRTGNRTNR